MTDWNQDVDTTLIKKGFVSIFDGGTPFRFKKMFQIIDVTQADFSKSYNDTLEKRLASIGNSSSIEIRTKKTADLFDTTDPPTDQKTLSWLKLKINTLNEMPEMDIESITESESASDKFVTERGIYFATNIREERNPSDGEYDIVITGELKSMTTPGHRTATV